MRNADSAVEPRSVSEQRQELPSRARPVRPQAPPGAEAALLGPHPIDPVDRAAAGARVDPVEPRGVETEDASWFRTMNAVAVPAAVRRNSPRVRPRRRTRRATSSSRRRAARRCFADGGRGHHSPFETSDNGKGNRAMRGHRDGRREGTARPDGFRGNGRPRVLPRGDATQSFARIDSALDTFRPGPGSTARCSTLPSFTTMA